MFAPFLSSLRTVAARSADWASRRGPVALLGYSGGVPDSAARLLSHMYAAPADSDHYARLTWHDATPIECPPESVTLLPVLRCGCMYAGKPCSAATHAKSSDADDKRNGNDDNGKVHICGLDDKVETDATTAPSCDDWHIALYAATTELLEKGYIPVSAGGDGTATLSMLEAYKALYPTEEVVLLHFAAMPRLSACDSPLRVLLDKSLVKGMVSIANRCVSVDDRKVRKQHKVLYMDLHAIYAKGLFCIRDLRNDYGVFISIDANVLDPAFAPAVPMPVPGGLSTRELLHIVSGIRGTRVVGVDVHGYHPALDVYRGDGLGLTQMALAKVLKECIVKAYMISTCTQEEGIARVQVMQREGTMSSNPYADV